MTERIIDNELRLIPYYRNDEASLPWYQDLDESGRQVSTGRSRMMWSCCIGNLIAHGDCYYIEYCFAELKSLSLSVKNTRIIILEDGAFWKKALEKGMERVKANIYSFNGQSQRMFQSVGFEKNGGGMV